MAFGTVQQRVPARPYLPDRVRAPAIAQLPEKGCSPPDLLLSEELRATPRSRFPCTKTSLSATVCHAILRRATTAGTTTSAPYTSWQTAHRVTPSIRRN